MFLYLLNFIYPFVVLVKLFSSHLQQARTIVRHCSKIEDDSNSYGLLADNDNIPDRYGDVNFYAATKV